MDDDEGNETKSGEKGSSGKGAADENQSKFLALATSILHSIKNGTAQGANSNPSNNNVDDGQLKGQNRKALKAWRFENPDGASTKNINGREMKWCTNDCHPKPMWCGRKNCLSKADFARKMEERKKGGNKK